MQQLIIHIGTGKTGTTALQHCLAMNFTALCEARVLYPRSLRLPGKFKTSPMVPWEIMEPLRAAMDEVPGNFFAEWYDWTNIKASEQSLQEYASELTAECHLSRCDRAIISNENFSYDSYYVHHLSNFVDMVAPREVKVIVYLRRQDHLLEALYAQSVKFDGNSTNECYVPPYYSIIQEYAAAFGADNIIVRPYESQQLLNGDVIEDFFQACEIPAPPALVRPALADSNKSVACKSALEFLKLFNRYAAADLEKSRMLGSMLTSVDLSVFERYSVFASARERQDYLASHESENSNVARQFLNREDGVLFFDPIEPAREISCELPRIDLLPVVLSLASELTVLRDFVNRLEHRLDIIVGEHGSSP